MQMGSSFRKPVLDLDLTTFAKALAESFYRDKTLLTTTKCAPLSLTHNRDT